MKKKKIIIIEDEFIIARDIQKTLEVLGYEVLNIFGSGEEFLAEIQNYGPDLVLMDILLEGELTGLETAAILHQSYSVPVIFLTAHAEKDKIEKAKKADTYGYLIKPYNDKELETTIEITLYKHEIYQHLQESEKRYETILQTSQNGIIITNIDGDILFTNERARNILYSYFPDITDPENIKQIFSEAHWKEFYDNLIMEQLKILTSLVDIKTPDGRTIKIETTVSIIMVDKNANIVFQINDLTDQYNSYKHMKMLTTAIRSIDECLYITDENHHVVYTNDTFQTQLGFNFDAIYSKNIFSTLFKKVSHETLQVIREGLTNGGWNGEMELDKEDGEKRTFYVTMSLVNDQSTYIVGILRDISLELDLKKQVNQIQRLESIGKLAGGIAHDFNNILSIINGYSELILSKTKKDFLFYDFLKEIHEAGIRASVLTRQLLLFSKKEPGEIEKFNPNTIIHGLYKMLARLIGENIDLQIDLDDDLFDVLMDKGQFEQILMNLTINARDALNLSSNPRKEIQIKTENTYFDEVFVDYHIDSKVGYYIKMTVADNGPGISEEYQDKIFDPFFSTKGEEQGTGLGLSTVYGIVKKYDGIITLHSEVDAGTEFHIYLPKCEDNFINKTLASTQIQKGKGTILIVEDSQPLLRVSEEMIKTLGYRTFSASTAEEAFFYGKTYGAEIDLLFTDLILSEYDGCMVYNELLKYNPKLKVLYTSGYDDDYLKNCNLNIPQQYFIRKPFDRKYISQLLSELLGS
ncbi:MAG: response regulator [Candidatus Marinimicrobia bacterium]|nr:response regulator [Candidatus Neomarinimicrobiota bacterium]